MDRELARKQPANVTPVVPVQTRTTVVNKRIIRHADQREVIRQVTKLARGGVISPEYRLENRRGVWVALVTLNPPPSWLRRHRTKLLVAGGILAVVGAIVWWVTATIILPLLAAAASVGLGTVGGVVLGALLLATFAGGGTITVIQKVTIRR